MPDSHDPFVFYIDPRDLLAVPMYVFAYTGWKDYKHLRERMLKNPPSGGGPHSVYVLTEQYYLGWDRLSPIGSVSPQLRESVGVEAFGEFLADIQKSLVQVYAMPPFLQFYIRQAPATPPPTFVKKPKRDSKKAKSNSSLD